MGALLRKGDHVQYCEAVDYRSGRMKARLVTRGTGGPRPPQKGKGGVATSCDLHMQAPSKRAKTRQALIWQSRKEWRMDSKSPGPRHGDNSKFKV